MTSLPLTSPIAARAYLQRKMKAALAAGQGLSGLVDAYEAMCLRPIQGIPAAQDARLFETGTYSFSLRGTERLFHFDLVRQLPCPDPPGGGIPSNSPELPLSPGGDDGSLPPSALGL